MNRAIIWVSLWALGCSPKPTDTSTMDDLNPCQEGEILASNGECVDGEADDTGE